VLALAAVLLLALPESVSRRLKVPVREALYPVQQGAARLLYRASESVRLIRGLGGLVSEKRRLESEVAWLRLRMAQMERLAEENRRLRRMLSFARGSEFVMIPAEVIGRDTSGWWHAVRINAGSRRGVTTNAAVITVDGLVGRVVEVSPHTAEVLLLSDPSLRISAVVSSREAYGVVRGTGGGGRHGTLCVMEFIDREAAVAPGDRVVSSGLGGVMPRGLLVGYIEGVRPAEGGLYKVADVAAAADLESLTYVMVVLAKSTSREGVGRP